MIDCAIPLHRVQRMSRNDSDSEQERALPVLFAKARLQHTQNERLQAEQTYVAALAFACHSFGSRSAHAATAHYFLCAFYADCSKPYSARQHFEELQLILRWRMS